MLRLTELFSEKFVKKLIRNSDNSDIEDALKRLDRLTQEEVQMAAAQLLKVTNTIDNRVEEIADNMLGVNNRVAGVGDQVQGVGDQVQGVGDQVQSVGDQVQSVGDQVQGIDDKVTAAMDGA